MRKVTAMELCLAILRAVGDACYLAAAILTLEALRRSGGRPG
jgi:hypothetical protein